MFRYVKGLDPFIENLTNTQNLLEYQAEMLGGNTDNDPVLIHRLDITTTILRNGNYLISSILNRTDEELCVSGVNPLTLLDGFGFFFGRKQCRSGLQSFAHHRFFQGRITLRWSGPFRLFCRDSLQKLLFIEIFLFRFLPEPPAPPARLEETTADE